MVPEKTVIETSQVSSVYCTTAVPAVQPRSWASGLSPHLYLVVGDAMLRRTDRRTPLRAARVAHFESPLMRIRRTPTIGFFLILCVATACEKDEPKPPATATDSVIMASDAAAWQARKTMSDSVIKHAPDLSQIREKLGATRYDEADAALTAAVLKEAEKTRDCYVNAWTQYDPSLTVVLYVLVNFGGAGWDLIRVEQNSLSSPAGGAVVSCINARAKDTWKLPTKGVKPGAHLVKLVYTPDSARNGAKR